jgi:hypothetical protein
MDSAEEIDRLVAALMTVINLIRASALSERGSRELIYRIRSQIDD